MSESEAPPSNNDRSPSRHLARPSLATSASGIADSTISFNTYATGITEGSLRLSQFPPPPVTIPSTASPTSDRFPHSPAQSTFPVTAPPRPGPITDLGQPSPSQSTFTVTAPPRPGPITGLGQPSPSQSTFTVIAPPPPGPIAGLGQSSPSQSTFEVSANSIRRRVPLSPHDWHEGSSIITVDPTEDRMLSTSFITELLSSTASLNSPDSPLPRPPSSQADERSIVSEKSYPPSPHHYVPVAGPSRVPRSPLSPHSPQPFLGQSVDSHYNGEDDTVGSYSYEGHAAIIRPAPGLTKNISVIGMAPATLRHIGSASSIPESLHPRSQTTYGSTVPLNLYPISGFPPGIDQTSFADIQPVTGTSPFLPSKTPESHSSTFAKSQTISQRRESAYSTRSMRSHVSSLISTAGQHTARAARATLEWMRVKPLPRLPTIPNVSLSQEQEHRRMEGAVPLPQLAERADRLTALLDTGHLPHDSAYLSPGFGSDKDGSGGQGRRSVYPDESQPGSPLKTPKSKSLPKVPISRSRKIKLFVGVSVLALLILIGIVIGVTVGHKHVHGLSCPSNRTGNTCSLDPTCVCTSSSTSQCNPLAQSLVNLVPFVNDRFNANFTLATVVNAMTSGASAPGNDCAAQARVVDVSPALDAQSVPNRTEWAQGALLWSFVLSQNTSGVGNLRDFISTANWKSLPVDGPIAGFSSKFSTTELGYTFDFAAQIISEPSVSFVTDGQPSSGQLAEVNNIARAALDRMYTFASASSALRTTAMANYWQNVLQQDPSKFPTFASLLISSPILLPFDANGTAGTASIASLLTNSTSTPFPPPLSCYPGLTQSQFQLITSLETSVFGLSAPATQVNFDNSCYADRPIYGVLNILHLRLPFQDWQTGAKQGAILSRDASPRAVVYNGHVLSGLPTSYTSSIPTTDPRQFGTLQHMSHVLLDFFESIPDINVARQLVEYVLSSRVTPPTNDTLLGQYLNTIPTIEVAVFGSVTPVDVTGVVSSFTTPSGGLFFGTTESLAVRTWAIATTQSSVTWTEFANSSEVVDDSSFTDASFNAVWNPAYLYFHSSSNATVNVGNITAGFAAVNKFTST
ncbi:hypothetical protein F5148DRAFT_972413 [Russula earlei]|uniref:Uncharacterized protein n=1 Tax=Russula earlei TaxID=71964 RepID=A0ACC0UNZ6_9AGAM|nr:hypothetical protein F5148DRAFT_972413 [Russula earlei]